MVKNERLASRSSQNSCLVSWCCYAGDVAAALPLPAVIQSADSPRARRHYVAFEDNESNLEHSSLLDEPVARVFIDRCLARLIIF